MISDVLEKLGLNFAQQVGIGFVVLFILVAILFAFLVVLSMKNRALADELEDKTEYITNMMDQLRIDGFIKKQKEMEGSIQKIQESIEHNSSCIDKIKVIRYGSKDTKTDGNFVVGFTNQLGDGVVLTARENNGNQKVTVKTIKDGDCQDGLDNAERVAIDRK